MATPQTIKKTYIVSNKKLSYKKYISLNNFLFNYFFVYLSVQDDLDIEGLDYLQWSLFDSPDEKGSGYKFMERQPVYILDKIVKKTRRNFNIILGYVTPSYGNKYGLSSKDSHRVGRAVRIKILNPQKRMDLVRLLIIEGVTRIAVAKDMVYYDTDDLKERGLYLW